MINYSKQLLDDDDLKSVVKVLKSDWLTTGPNVKKFEDKISKATNSKYTTVVNSASSGLHIACISLGLGHNDIVWTSANTFVSSINCALHCGAKIDLIDINLKNYNLDIEKLSIKLKDAKKKRQATKNNYSSSFCRSSV